MLAAMYLPSINISNKAVAVIETLDNPCILALGRSGTDVEIAASTALDMSICSIAANSSDTAAIELDASTSSIVAATLVAAGEVSMQLIPINPAAPPPELSLASSARIGAPLVADPYAGTLTHTFLTSGMPATGHCKRTTSGSLIVYKTGNCVIPGLTIKTGKTVDLAPGTYWITGNLTVAAGGLIECSKCNNANGIGVTIILPAYSGKIGAASVTNALFNLNAPEEGQFAGIVMAQDANGLPPGTTYLSSNSSITGAAGATLNGLVYFPNSSLTFHANPSASGPKCLLLVINWLNIDQNSSLDSTGCAMAGLANLPAVSTVALAE
jgi:hypothetical protein